MGGGKPQATKAPFQQQQQTTNTFAPQSIARTPEAESFLGLPLDFGDDVDIDPGIGRRTDLAEEEAINRVNSAFSGGTPNFIRQASLAKDLRGIRSQGAAERAQAEYARQQSNNARRTQMTLTELERRRQLLPQIVQTGGSGTSSGFNTQVTAPQPGFLSQFAGGLGAGLGGALKIPSI